MMTDMLRVEGLFSYVPAVDPAASEAPGALRSRVPSAACPRPATTGPAVAAAQPATEGEAVSASRSSASRSWGRELREGRPEGPRAAAGLQVHPRVSVRAHSKHT